MQKAESRYDMRKLVYVDVLAFLIAITQDTMPLACTCSYIYPETHEDFCIKKQAGVLLRRLEEEMPTI